MSAPIAARHERDPTSSGTVVVVEDHTPTAGQVADVIARVPGARVRTTGGFGSFSSLALRGAEFGHTTVLFGMAPLNTPDTGAFDLSTLPLSALGSVEIYRGGAPVWLGGGAIGGLVRFVPRPGSDRLARVDAGLGSFGLRQLLGTAAVAGSGSTRPSLLWHVGVSGARNDYPYVDDGQTRFVTADDVELRQRNGQVAAGHGLVHAALGALGGRVELTLAGFGRASGIPGPLAAPTLRIRQQLLRTLGSLSYERETLDRLGQRESRFQLVVAAAHQTNRFTDRFAELGTSKTVASNDRWLHGYVRAAASLRLASFLEVTGIGSFAREGLDPHDALAFLAPPRPSRRNVEIVALETRWLGRVAGKRVELRPSMRLQWSQAAIEARTSFTHSRRQARVFAPTFRLGAVVELGPGMALASSAATGKRIPSVFELFGDRVFQEPNPSLVPERSRSLDAGLSVRSRVLGLFASAEARVFATWLRDLIRFRRTAQFTVRPGNVAQARILGTELGASAEGPVFALVGSLTAMRSTNSFGKELPFRPPLQLHLRPELRLLAGKQPALAVFGELSHVSFVYLDDANRTHLDGRSFVDAGLRCGILRGRLVMSARVKNLFDARAMDMLSRPLPGRQFLVSVTIEEGRT
ncbi:MAG: TonB-dependent receptor [Proteobacteria bacterium]|nr:TonB-dependent receptor [Pseudomonadota bacterium]